MARILAISSQVAHGTVGLSIIVPTLQALGHEVIGLPTVILSNHPGHAHVAGEQIAPKVLHAMLDALEANGWLTGLDAILTGYLPSADHVAFAAEAVRRVREVNGADAVTYLCDPVLGDDPKGLYIDESAAKLIRSALLPAADIATPNRFELSYISGSDVRSPEDAVRCDVLNELGAATFATSIPSPKSGELCNVMTTAGSGPGAMTTVPRRARAPHGTGDLFSALLLSAWLDRQAPTDALAYATAGVDFALDGSMDPDAISVSALPLAATPLDWPVTVLAATQGSRARTTKPTA